VPRAQRGPHGDQPVSGVIEHETSSQAHDFGQPVWFHADLEAEARLNRPARPKAAASESPGSRQMAGGIHGAKLKR